MTISVPNVTVKDSATLKRKENMVSTVTVPTFIDDNVQIAMATTVDLVEIQPQSEIIIPVHVGKFKHGTTVILEPKGNLSIEHQVAGGKTISTVLRGIASYRLMNPTNSTVYIPRRTKIAKAETIQSNRVTKFTEGSSAPINSLSETTSNQLCSELSELGFNLDNLELTVEQKQQIQNFLIQNRDIFAKDLSELGHTNLHYHTIYTGDAKPISAAPYRQSPQMRKELDKQLDEMERNNIIEESTSPWHSPVVLVKKRNGSIRVCVDYRALNRITEPMSAVIPTMTDIFDTLADSKPELFSSLDLTSGFWQVPLDPSTKHKSAFITHKGVYEFNRLPFGMMNSPLTFQCLMTKVLKDLNFKIALVYIDDILIFSKNFEDHLNHLQQVFSNLREANLKLNPEKCKFATRTIKYLGHVISKDGIRVNPENTDKVKDFSRPTTAKQVKSFLGMANYYRKFVKDYAHIAAPLTKLLKKDQRFKWTPECDIAFENLKDRLTSAPILSFPHLDKPFILATDSSEFSNGYILSQIQNGLEHVIAYGGRQLRGSELKWHITDKEALALVEGVQHFKHYLANQEFTVYTDNISVKYLQKIKDCQGRLGRWSLLLQGYNFKIQHRAGSKNPADCLSRQKHLEINNSASYDSSELADHLGSIDIPKEYSEVTFIYKGENEDAVISSLQTVTINDIQLTNLAEEQETCRGFADIIKYKQTGRVPQNPELARAVVAESYNFELEDGILKHFYSKRCKKVPKDERLVKQIAVPRNLRDSILKAYHDCILGGGHQGFERTYAAIRNKYFWPTMYSDINQYVKTCEVCQQSKRAFNSKPPPLQPQPTNDIFGRWHMDILSGLPTTKDKYKHVLLVVDSYSKWCEAFPLRSEEAGEVANVLYREIISRYGAPRTLLSDRGRNFVSNLVKALSELFNIKRHLTSSYHPQTNGACERMNSVILQALRAYTKDQQDDWYDVLPGILMAYRATPATQSTDYSPFFLLYGREMTLPIDTALIPKDRLAQDHKIFLSRILQNLETSRKIAAKNIKQAQERYKQQYDKKSKEPQFQPAQRVWLYCTKVPVGKAPKLHRKWSGPYYITRIGPNSTYKLRNCATNKEVVSMVNAQRMKPYYDPKDRPTNLPDEFQNDNEELNPEEIQDDNINDNDRLLPNNRQQPVPPINNNGINRQQPPIPVINNNRPTQNQQQLPVDRINNRQQQNQQPAQNSETNKRTVGPSVDSTVNAPVKDNKPSCQDCKNNKCKAFKEEEIQQVLSSVRGNGTLYYKLKFTDKSRNTEWYFPCKVPAKLIREFHAHRTMSGKKRKRPLQQNKHKFFTKPDPAVNSVQYISTKVTADISTQTETINEQNQEDENQQLLAVKIVNNRPYFLIKSGNTTKYESMTSAPNIARQVLIDHKERFKQALLQQDIQYAMEKRLGKENQRDCSFQIASDGKIHEIRYNIDGTTEYLSGYRNPVIAPEWDTFDSLSNASINNFINVLEQQYKIEISMRRR
ncbi:unnamed protein product [Mytilus edulis]|uniref:Endonuclease n=1 Tax=Mytilus edulis TaxID=6550 RepID=A0A8S3Q4J8_MYTED|nr:unnamed protein product [Mytilus edulis]